MRKRPINCCFCSFRLAAYCSLAPTQQFLQLIQVTKWTGFIIYLSGHVTEIQAEVEVVKIKNPDFSCWA